MALENVSVVGAHYLYLNGSDPTTTTEKTAGFKPHPRCKHVHHSDYRPTHENLLIQVANYVIFSIAVFGLGTNLLSFIILSKDRSNNTSIFYLRCLAVADMFICLSYIIFDFQFQLYSHTLLLDMTAEINHAMKRMYAYTLNIRLVFSDISDMITLLIAIDRYIVVCWPLKAKRIVSIKKNYIYVAFAVMISVCDRLREFFKYSTARSINRCTGHEIWYFRLTAFSLKNVHLRYYEVFASAPLLVVIPTVIVVLITIRLIFTLRRAGAARKTMSTTNQTSNSSSSSSSSSSSDRSLTLALILISCFYIVKKAFTFRAVIKNLIIALYGRNPAAKSTTQSTLIALISQNLVRMIVASSNFVIYCVSRRRFRNQLNAIFLPKRTID
ncbi:FMRFamide receptor-like [Tubulanus polymorphus]|uniref:FMRFamide receptor-like n=1 Tax=Tubulanus polymorphus TaxID=672921 RepID=UPI003DA66463